MNRLFVGPGVEETGGENREETWPASCIKAVRHDESWDSGDSAENGDSGRPENRRGDNQWDSGSKVTEGANWRCESWAINKAECRRIDAFELWCWRRLLRVSWTSPS